MKKKRGGALRCILHIGPIKSGSTSLQHFCFANRERLLQQHGVLYPLSPKDPAGDIHSHIKLSRAKPDYIKQKLIPELRSEIQVAVARGAHTVLLSDEETQYVRRDGDKIRSLLELLQEVGCGRPRIVVYLREPAGLFLSLCAQSALAGDARIWEQVMPENNFQWRQAVNHKATLDLWSEVCGRERVFPRLLDRKSFEGGSLERDFFAAAGLQWDEGFTIPPPQNESFPAVVVELVRALNGITQGGTFTAQNFKFNIVRQLKRLHADGQDRDLPGLMAPPRVYEAYRNFFLNDYEAIRAEWFPQREQLFALRDMDEYAAAWEKYPAPDRRGLGHIAKLCSLLAIGEAMALGSLKKAGLPMPGLAPLPPKAGVRPPGGRPGGGPPAAMRQLPPGAVPPGTAAAAAAAGEDAPGGGAIVTAADESLTAVTAEYGESDTMTAAAADESLIAVTAGYDAPDAMTAAAAAEELSPPVMPSPASDLPETEAPQEVPAVTAATPLQADTPAAWPPAASAAGGVSAAPAAQKPVRAAPAAVPAAPAAGGARSVLEEVLGRSLDPHDTQALQRAERTLYRRQNSLTPQQLQQAGAQLRELMQAAGLQVTLPAGRS